jgi:hypothetical protein
VSQYLERYAEPESRLAERVDGAFEAVLVVPAHRESVALLDGFRAAGAGARGRLLVILVVNAARDARAESRAETRLLLDEIEQLHGPGVVLSREPALLRYELSAFTLLVVDRASPGAELPEKQGVGLARKIGADLACALFARGRVELPFVFSSDADTELPAGYVEDARRALAGSDAVGLIYPYRHVSSGDALVDRATSDYELGLRYHVLGLRSARSPYAFHTIGSALAFTVEGYELARGFPKRQAGEDFYLLEKLAKLGSLVAVGGDAVRVRSRFSDRVPFGTGARAKLIAAELVSGEPTLYHPEIYRVLGHTLAALVELARERDVSRFEQALASEPVAGSALADLGLRSEVPRALAGSKTSVVLLRRLLTWFDGLRTLRFLHALEKGPYRKLPMSRALAAASFLPDGAREAEPAAALETLREQDDAYRGPFGVPAALSSLLGSRSA